MPLKRMQRLAPLLASPEASGAEWPDVRFSAGFRRDRQGQVVVDLRVAADLPLICQRSLEPYLEHVERHSRLAVVETAEEGDRVPAHYDPVQAEHGRLALQDLVEDELLLGLPQVPRNPDLAAVHRSTDPQVSGAEAAAQGDDGEEPTHRPFEGLGELLKARKN